MRIKCYSAAILFAVIFISQMASAQFYYANEPLYNDRIESAVVLKNELNKSALENQKLILPGVWKFGEFKMVDVLELNNLLHKESTLAVLPLAKRNPKTKWTEYYLCLVTTLMPDVELKAPNKKDQVFLNRNDFDVLAEIPVDSVLYMDGLYRRMYMKSILRYADEHSRNFEKKGSNDLYRWGFAVYKPDTIFIKVEDIANHLRKPETIAELTGKLSVVRSDPAGNIFRAALRNKQAIADVFELKREEKRFVVRCVYTLDLGLIYMEERELQDNESGLFGKSDISRFESQLKEAEITRLKAGGPIGR